ncbi:MAG: carboxypeptidase regulatory-like domain-containing protein [Euryarchaeota archaeon]|nr:carboxypeptidase regulatory-like domain-containing protein [Euryarchaeota archaeon]
MSRIPTLAVAAVTLLLLAGCSGSEPATKSTAPQATHTPETGGIDGLLVDDEQVPVAKANVSLHTAAGADVGKMSSAEDGTYAFSKLEPGIFHVNVSAFGFHPASTKVVVFADESVKVTTVLTRIVVARPIPELVQKKGFINCSFSTPANGGGFYSYNMCRNQANEQSQFQLSIDPKRNASEVVLEAVWQPGPSGLGQRLQMWLCSDKDDSTNYMNCIQFVGSNPYATRTQGASPLVMRRTDLPFKTVPVFEVDLGDGHFDGTSARVPVTAQQNFDLYITVCYILPCTADYQGRPPA